MDEEVRLVVERIFRMAAEGIGPYTIARRLSEDKIEKPSYYQARNGIGPYKNRCNMDTPYAWRGVTIQRMLEKPEYMGDTVNFRTTTESFNCSTYEKAYDKFVSQNLHGMRKIPTGQGSSLPL